MHRTQDAPSAPTQAFVLDSLWRRSRIALGLFFALGGLLMGGLEWLMFRNLESANLSGQMLLLALFPAANTLYGLYHLTQVRRGPALWLHDDGRFDRLSWRGRRVREHVDTFQGFRMSQQAIHTRIHLLRRHGHDALTLPLSSFVESGDVYEWFQHRLPDLDSLEIEQEQEALARLPTGVDDPDSLTSARARHRWLLGLTSAWLGVEFVLLVLHLNPSRQPWPDWRWVSIDTSLALLVFSAVALVRDRRHLAIDESRSARLSIVYLLMPLVAVLVPVLTTRPYELFHSWLPLAMGVPVAAFTAWLPGAPDVSLRSRLGLFPISLLFSLMLPAALNVGLAPRPVHTLHTARVTDIYPGAKGEFNVNWKYDEPVGSSTGGSWGRQREPLAVGTRYEVELARGALGWHWLVEMRQLGPAPGAP